MNVTPLMDLMELFAKLVLIPVRIAPLLIISNVHHV